MGRQKGSVKEKRMVVEVNRTLPGDLHAERRVLSGPFDKARIERDKDAPALLV